MEFGPSITGWPLQAGWPCYNASLKGVRITSPTVELLAELQSQNRYLFHGSDTITDLLEPAFTRSHGRRVRPQQIAGSRHVQRPKDRRRCPAANARITSLFGDRICVLEQHDNRQAVLLGVRRQFVEPGL